MPREVNWPLYQQLVDELLAVVKVFVARERIDVETMMAVIVMFQASMLTGPALRVQDQGADLEAFLAAYMRDVQRMLEAGIARARERGWHGIEPSS